jgi:hypothetical protein
MAVFSFFDLTAKKYKAILQNIILVTTNIVIKRIDYL